ncbi:hypothetical protein DY000_02025447 [Brassica cretica]|uniref:DC1 domain-containing protein n=1 Tax=Brassica cretica TaxID=69181 RepID=A0ABQ7EET7_BRACR|nr:hypothetical protein DY000_02025447 [Brassica cretica]
MHTIKIEETDHEHALYRDGHRHGLELECDRTYHDGICCRECKFTVHEQCVFLLRIQETSKHPFHDGHCVEPLTTGAPDHTDPTCHICGKNTKIFLYHCSTCKLNLDIDCMVDALCSQVDVNVLWYHHPLLMVDFGKAMICNFCRSGYDDDYFYPRCRLMVHEDCVFIFDSPEITHPCHVRHSLKLLTDGAPGYTDPEYPPPVALSSMKVHEHTITLMPRLISFVCDACGTRGDRSPYVCFQCNFVIHQKCAHLPSIIHINRHDHRVYYTYPLGPGEWTCGVCWEEIDWSCGAYSCSRCKYAVHSKCATREDVWDGLDLDGVPKLKISSRLSIVGNVGIFDLLCSSISEPFNHGCHPHPLLYLDVYSLDYVKKTCQGCGVGAQKVLGCIKCNFFVDFRCATLPSTIRLPRYNDHPLTLCYGDENASGKFLNPACHMNQNVT